MKHLRAYALIGCPIETILCPIKMFDSSKNEPHNCELHIETNKCVYGTHLTLNGTLNVFWDIRYHFSFIYLNPSIFLLPTRYLRYHFMDIIEW